MQLEKFLFKNTTGGLFFFQEKMSDEKDWAGQ